MVYVKDPNRGCWLQGSSSISCWMMPLTIQSSLKMVYLQAGTLVMV